MDFLAPITQPRYPPELDGKVLFLKTPQTSVKTAGEIKLAWTCKLRPPHRPRLVFIVVEGDLCVIGRKKKVPIFSSSKSHNDWPGREEMMERTKE